MGLLGLEVASSIFCSCPSSSSPKFLICPKPSLSTKLHISNSTLPLSLKSRSLPHPFISTSRKLSFEVLSAVQDVPVEEKPEETQEPNIRRKLFVLNLPWSYAVTDIKTLFSECGTAVDVEIIKQKDGKNRGFAFVTMDSGEEAQAVIDKFDSHEVMGRIIRVEFAKRFKKPSPPSPLPIQPPGEARYKIYVSNLAWKTRATHLRETFAAANFTPASARVVFDTPTGRSAGYGFVSFPTKEEAEAAISALNGTEVMGRPLDLKLSEKNSDEATVVKVDENSDESTEVKDDKNSDISTEVKDDKEQNEEA